MKFIQNIFIILYITFRVSELFIVHNGKESSVVVSNDKIKFTTKPRYWNPDEYDFDGKIRDVEGFYLIKKDVILPVKVPKLGSLKSSLWPKGIVPYIFYQDIDQRKRDELRKAFKHIELWTCIKFEQFDKNKHVHHKAYIVFKNGPICASMIGYHPSKTLVPFQQVVFISDLCPFGSMLHELMHALGFVHEEDRFRMMGNETRNIPYDIGSIMHSSKLSAREYFDPYREFLLGQREDLSFLDYQKINALYGCSKKCTNIDCLNQGYVGKDCQCLCPQGFEGKDCANLDSNARNFFLNEPNNIRAQQKNVLPREITLLSGSNRKYLRRGAPPEIIHDSEEEMLFNMQQQEKSKNASRNIPCAEFNAIDFESSSFDPELCTKYERTDYMMYIHKLPSYTVDLPSHDKAHIRKAKMETDRNDYVSLSNPAEMMSCIIAENVTYFYDANGFKLDQNHVFHFGQPSHYLVDCDFNRYSAFCNHYCPIKEADGWCYYEPKTLSHEDHTNDTNYEGYMYSRSRYHQEKPYGTLRIGPVDLSVLRNPCLEFYYTLQGTGVGGIVVNFINEPDLRFSFIDGWENSGQKWRYVLKRIKELYYQAPPLDNLIIEFTNLPEWDERSLISIDNMVIDECENLRDMCDLNEIFYL